MSTWLFGEVLARNFAEKTSKALVRTEGLMDKKRTLTDRPMDGWSVNEQKQWRQVHQDELQLRLRKLKKRVRCEQLKSDKWLILFTQSGSGPYSRFRRGKAPMWLSVGCWKKTKCYQEKEKLSLGDNNCSSPLKQCCTVELKIPLSCSKH